MLETKKNGSCRCADAVLSTQAYNQASLRIIKNAIDHQRADALKYSRPVSTYRFATPAVRQKSPQRPCALLLG